MLGCPAQTLEVMPYALAERAEDAGLCVCDLQVSGSYSRSDRWRAQACTHVYIRRSWGVFSPFGHNTLFSL